MSRPGETAGGERVSSFMIDCCCCQQGKSQVSNCQPWLTARSKIACEAPATRSHAASKTLVSRNSLIFRRESAPCLPRPSTLAVDPLRKDAAQGAELVRRATAAPQTRATQPFHLRTGWQRRIRFQPRNSFWGFSDYGRAWQTGFFTPPSPNHQARKQEFGNGLEAAPKRVARKWLLRGAGEG